MDINVKRLKRKKLWCFICRKKKKKENNVVVFVKIFFVLIKVRNRFK